MNEDKIDFEFYSSPDRFDCFNIKNIIDIVISHHERGNFTNVFITYLNKKGSLTQARMTISGFQTLNIHRIDLGDEEDE